MKVFSTTQIRDIDRYTIRHEPVSSIDLMERAARAIFDELRTMWPDISTPFCVFAGPGNNGGDALALSRMLCDAGYVVDVHLCNAGELSADCNENRIRLLKSSPEVLTEHLQTFNPPLIPSQAVIIDGLFGSGLSRALSGMYAEVTAFINEHSNFVVSVDIPSGLHGDSWHQWTDPTVKADITLSLQFPKIAFFLAENEKYVGEWKILEIGLHPDAIASTETMYQFTEATDLSHLLIRRSRFAHKGTFGHLAILAGCKGMAGASILAARAAMRSGAGLVTLHGPEGNRCILQTIVPEVIYDTDKHPDCISEFYHTQQYDAIAVGSGIGTRTLTVEMLRLLLQQVKAPLVLDADALNIIASQKKMMSLIPPGSILTPHPKEFDRLAGPVSNSFYRMESALAMAAEYKVYIVLKGAYSKIFTPEGKVYFNSTGNPGMATAGSGDVLTGIIGALLAQDYRAEAAARLGVYLHGLSADLALEEQSEESLVAGDIITGLGKAFKHLRGKN